MNETPETEDNEKAASQSGETEHPDERSSSLGVWIPVGAMFGIAIGGIDEGIGLAMGIVVGILAGAIVGLVIDRRDGRR